MKQKLKLENILIKINYLIHFYYYTLIWVNYKVSSIFHNFCFSVIKFGSALSPFRANCTVVAVLHRCSRVVSCVWHSHLSEYDSSFNILYRTLCAPCLSAILWLRLCLCPAFIAGYEAINYRNVNLAL